MHFYIREHKSTRNFHNISFFLFKSLGHLIWPYRKVGQGQPIIIIGFLRCRYRGHIHNSGPPSRQLACCTHGRSHTRSPCASIIRVDSWELPLLAISLSQLLSSYIGPPRPTLSINLYVKGCLDCTVGLLVLGRCFAMKKMQTITYRNKRCGNHL